MRIHKFLVVRADGSVRITSRTPNLRLDEVAYRVHVTMPAGWGRTASEAIELVMPDVPLMEYDGPVEPDPETNGEKAG
jgi:hypothetical protein